MNRHPGSTILLQEPLSDGLDCYAMQLVTGFARERCVGHHEHRGALPIPSGSAKMPWPIFAELERCRSIPAP